MHCLYKLLPVLLFGSIIMGCEPLPDENKLLDDYVVSTNFSQSAQFGNYNTYVLPADTIGLVSNVYGDDTIIVASSSGTYPRVVVNTVRDNLNTKGFTRVERDEDPDLLVNVFIVRNLDIFQQYNYYPDYYSPYNGYYNYYYGGYQSVSTYAQNTGFLVVEIVDLNDTNVQQQAKVIWSAYMGDVFGSFGAEEISINAINQAFQQSPYLTTN